MPTETSCLSGQVLQPVGDPRCGINKCVTVASGTSTTLPVCAQDARKCPDGRFVSRNPNNRCEFYECPPSGGDRTQPVITQFEITPSKVPLRSEVYIRCVAKDEKLDRTEITILTPSGRSDVFVSVDGRGYFADQQGGYTVNCRARDTSGNTAERTQTFFTHADSATKKSCQGECCVFEDKFEDKFCGAGFKCEDRRCEKIEEKTERFREIPGITTVSQIVGSPGKFENFVVTVSGSIERDSCATGGYESGINAPIKTTASVSAREIVTGRATAASRGAQASLATAESGKCFPFVINDGTGRIGLVGFGSDVGSKKIELKGVVRTYESGGSVVPFLKVEGRSEFEERREFATTEVTPVFAQRSLEESKNTEACFKMVRKYAIRLTHNEEVQNAFKKNRDLWNHIDKNYQDTVSNLADVCKEEPEIVTDYLSRAVQNEISKNMNYGFETGFESPEGRPQTAVQQSSVVPIIVVTRDISNTQIDELRKTSGVSFSGSLPIEPLDKLTIIRMPALKENIDLIKKLSFVEDVKVDSVNLIVHEDVSRAFEPRKLERFEIPKDDLLKKLEVIKSLSSKDDDQASLSESQDSILQTGNSLDDFENETSKRGLGYTLSWVLGAAAEQEKKDAEFLNNQITQLENTINILGTVASGTEDIAIKTNLKEQVDILKKQVDAIKKVSETKKKNAGGLLAMIRNLFGG